MVIAGARRIRDGAMRPPARARVVGAVPGVSGGVARRSSPELALESIYGVYNSQYSGCRGIHSPYDGDILQHVTK